MGSSGPIYPGAITTRWHGDAWPGRAINPDRGVLHTTEGHGLPGYRAGADHPHFTALPRMEEKRLVIVGDDDNLCRCACGSSVSTTPTSHSLSATL